VVVRRAPVLALLGACSLIIAAVLIPAVTGWDVHARTGSGPTLPPWHGYLDPKVGPGTAAALAIGILGVSFAARLARTLSFGGLLGATYVASLAWLLALALVDGTAGISRVLGNPDEYLPTARQVDDVGALLRGYVARVPLDSPDHWPTHVAGHPPGMLLFFVGLVRVGLGGDLAAGLVVTCIAATVAPAVLLTLRILGAEPTARRVAPFLVLTPAAVYLAVSADAVMTAVSAWAMVLLALGATRGWWWSVPAGLLFGFLVMMSYGLVLFGIVALAMLVGLWSWRPLLPCAASALAVVVAFSVVGFTWWQAFPVLVDRYWAGIAADRPAAYWSWANLALLLATAGPLVASGCAEVRRLTRAPRALVLGAWLAVGIAAASLMSKAEVERIWLPFMPWLTIGIAALPDRWQRPGLALQIVVALLLQHLLYTSW